MVEFAKHGGKVVRYLVDLSVVFVGVFGAFWLTQYSEDQRNRAEERLYLQVIREDVVSDTADFARLNTKNDRNINCNSLAISLLGRGDRSDAVGKLLLEAALNHSIVRAGSSTWDALVSTGDLNLVHNHRLRLQIASMYGSYGVHTLWGDLLTDYTVGTAIPRLIESVDFETGRISQHGSVSDPALMNFLTAKKTMLVAYRGALEESLRRCRKTLELLNAELAGGASEEEAS